MRRELKRNPAATPTTAWPSSWMAMARSKAANINHGYSATVTMSQWLGKTRAKTRPMPLTKGGCQTKIVKVATKTKPDQTARNLAEPLRVDSILGIGARRSRIGVGLVEVCAVVALTVRRSLTRKKRL